MKRASRKAKPAPEIEISVGAPTIEPGDWRQTLRMAELRGQDIRISADRNLQYPPGDMAHRSRGPSSIEELVLRFGVHAAPGMRALLCLLDEGGEAAAAAKALLDVIDEAVARCRYQAWESSHPFLTVERAARQPGCPDVHQSLLACLASSGADRSYLRTSRSAFDEAAWACFGRLVQIGSGAAMEEVIERYLGLVATLLPTRDASDGAEYRIQMGPLPWDQYLALLPLDSGSLLAPLLEIADLFLGPQASVEVLLIVDRHEIPRTMQSGNYGLLRWTTFLTRSDRAPASDARVLVTAANCARVLRRAHALVRPARSRTPRYRNANS